MKKLLQKIKNWGLLVLVVILFTNVALASEVTLGYCEGSIAVKDEYGTITGRAGNGEISLAIYVPSHELLNYVDNAITAVNFGIPESDKLPETATVWIKSDTKDSTPISSGMASLVCGWNKIALEKPMNIDRTIGGLWIGVTYTQTEKLNIISFVGETNANACWVAKNGSWTDFSTKGFGSLSLECVIEGDKMPKWNLGLRNAYAPQSHIHIDSPIVIKGTVVNQAVETIRGYYVNWNWEGSGKEGTEFVEAELAYRQENQFSITVPSEGISQGIHTLHLNLAIPDFDDEDLSDNGADITVEVYETGFPKTLLLEQFTSEYCGYCPTGIAAINDALVMEELADRVVWVSHHVGFRDDWLTSPLSNSYLELYGTSQTFAPAMTLNRTFVEGHSELGPVGGVGDKYDVADWLGSLIDGIAYIGVEITSFSYSEGKVKLEFDLKKDVIIDDMYDQLYVSVFLLEEDIPMIAQVDYAGNKATGIHEGTFRTELSEPWGDPIEWSSNIASFSYETLVPEDWNKNNLKAVVFVNKYDETDINAREVLNCASAMVSTTGINDIFSDTPAVSVEYYSLDGCRVVNPKNGVFIKLVRNEEGVCKSCLVRK